MTTRIRRSYDATQAYTITVETPAGVSDEGVTQVLSGLSLAPGMAITAREVGDDLVPDGWEVVCSDGELDSTPILSDLEVIKVERQRDELVTPPRNGRQWRVVLLRPGDKYGRNDSCTADRPLVEFWDMTVDKRKFPEGQFVSRYWLTTLLTGELHPLILDGGVPEWTVTASDMALVVGWLNGLLMTAALTHWSTGQD